MRLGLHLAGEPIHEMDFGADRPHRARRARGDLRDDVFGRSRVVGGLHDVERHLGMHDDANAGMVAPDVVDLPHGEAGVHRAVALPQDHARALQRRPDRRRPTSRCGSHTTISSSGTPILWAVLRPRC